jgi:hypothetical protein
MAILSAQEKGKLEKQHRQAVNSGCAAVLSASKKSRIEQCIVANGKFNFCGRTFVFNFTVADMRILVAFDSYLDTAVEVFDEDGDAVGIAQWITLEVSHGTAK